MKLLITGGAGFIGINSAFNLTEKGHHITILDNLSRPGSTRNLAWLKRHYPSIDFLEADVRDRDTLNAQVRGMDGVIHLAAQVAVTSSLVDPLNDFDVNLRGTLNVLEAIRHYNPEAPLLFASTNKVYGNLTNVSSPISEECQLDFHTPYGVSKGAADQYVHDYARCFGLKTAVLRQSCIYGRNQFGTEDQGWVAHFVHSILAQLPLKIYGDGSQIRDLLNVEDLVNLYEIMLTKLISAPKYTGLVYNVGGGPSNARNLLQVLGLIESIAKIPAIYSLSAVREGDQAYFVADISKIRAEIGWEPKIDVETGIIALIDWARNLDIAGTLMSVSVLGQDLKDAI